MNRPAPSNPFPAFQCGNRVFTLDDVLAAARARGELDSFLGAGRERWAAARRAEAAGLVPDDAEIESALDSFRYARDLISGEECDRWLEARGLEFDDLVGCVTRRLQSALAAAGTVDFDGEEAATSAGDVSDDESLVRVDALLSDEFNLWARQLARAVALAAQTDPAAFADPTQPLPWTELNEGYAAAAAALTTAPSRQSALAGRRLDLIQVRYEQAEFDSPGAAREAVLCTREDNASLSAIAEANAFPCEVASAFLGDLPPAWAEVLTSARLGEAVLPRETDGRIVVLAPLSRREPSLEDPAIVARLDAILVEQHFRELETRHIRWLINVELAP